MVDVVELIAWGLDDYPCRISDTAITEIELARRVELAQQTVASREFHVSRPAIVADKANQITSLLSASTKRDDLQEEYAGSDWALSVVDLRCLLAFQRRLVFDPSVSLPATPMQEEWPGLTALAIGPKRATSYRLLHQGFDSDAQQIMLYSSNPDLEMRPLKEGHSDDPFPVSLHGGNPFLEVAELRGRWFLRDGYHRAYRLLQAGVYFVPAVIINTRTIEELGATQPWFFDEENLFSDRPPLLTDFVQPGMVLHYKRRALRKVIRIRIEQTLQPFDEPNNPQGEPI
jgi:hypothetical protein